MTRTEGGRAVMEVNHAVLASAFWAKHAEKHLVEPRPFKKRDFELMRKPVKLLYGHSSGR